MTDVYVSITRGANNGVGSIQQPFKLLWKVLKTLGDNTTVHVAEGRYTGQGKTSVFDRISKRNIVLIGGYNESFTERNPFKYLTILGAPEGQDTNISTNTVLHIEPTEKGNERIVIDGFSIDRGECAHYVSDGEPGPNQRIEGHKDSTCFGYQAMNTKLSGSNPTITVIANTGSIYVKNCMLINNPWWGIYVKGGGDGEIRVENNLILSYQGRGIESITGSGWGKPTHYIRFNTILFGKDMEGRAISADPRGSNGKYVIESNVVAFCDQGGVTVKFKDPDALELNNNLFFCCVKGDYNVGGSGICNADNLEDEVMFPCDNNVHELPKVISKLYVKYFDRFSQGETPSFISNFSKDSEVMEARASVGLAEYHLHNYDKTYETYAQLPQKRPNYKLSRYPHPMKIGQVMDWSCVLPLIGADEGRGTVGTPI